MRAAGFGGSARHDCFVVKAFGLQQLGLPRSRGLTYTPGWLTGWLSTRCFGASWHKQGGTNASHSLPARPTHAFFRPFMLASCRKSMYRSCVEFGVSKQCFASRVAHSSPPPPFPDALLHACNRNSRMHISLLCFLTPASYVRHHTYQQAVGDTVSLAWGQHAYVVDPGVGAVPLRVVLRLGHHV